MDDLMEKALEAREMAYAPYSCFKVGAAIKTEEGKIFTGCNIENASYGLTICAERVALYKAVSLGYTKFTAMLNITGSHEPTPPCGACRQVMYEFAPDLKVIMMTTEGERSERSLRELLVGAFHMGSMEEGQKDG